MPSFRPSSRLPTQARSWLVLAALAGLVACETPSSVETPGAPEDEIPALERRLEPAVVPAKQRSRTSAVTTYRISRGGTLRNVANLYKIHHHEVIKLNPALDPDQDLEPSAEVVVFKDSGGLSESVGMPYDGSIVNAVPMVDGPGRKIMAERWKTWATRSTVQQLDHVLTRWSVLEPKAPPVLVGNLSARYGGAIGPHKSHQSGRDADLSYIARWDGKEPVMWQRMNAENLDAELTWRLLRLLAQEARVEAIYMDRSVQRLLLDHAKRHGTIRAARLPQWLEVAENSKTALIRHVAGHVDHFHVRFACPDDNPRCRS
jgi:murein endopeptidase